MSALIFFLVCTVVLYYSHNKLYEAMWNKGLSVEVAFSKSAVFEGESVTLVEKVANDKWLPLPYIRVEYMLSNNLVFSGNSLQSESRVSFFIVPPKKAVTKKTSIYCSKRGYYSISTVNLSSNNIFYSAYFQSTANVNAVLAVYPSQAQLEKVLALHAQLSGDVLVNRFIAPDFFFHKGMREYQPYDSFKQINFKAWARLNKPVSNVYACTVSQSMHLLLNTQDYSIYRRDDVFEQAIRLTAYLSHQYVTDGVAVRLTMSSEQYTVGKITSSMGLVQIYEALSKLIVPCDSPIIDLIPSAVGSDETLILISSYFDSDLIDMYNFYAARGIPCYWIVPRSKYDKDELPCVKNAIEWVVDCDD